MTSLAEDIKSLMDLGYTLQRAKDLAVQDRARIRVATASVTDASSRMTTLAEEIKSLMDIGCTLQRAEELAVQDRARFDVAAESMRKQVWAIMNKTADLVTGNKTLDLSDEVNSPLLSEKSEPKKTK